MKNSVGVIAIFKNESHILQEWINHYKREGIRQFILINNGSNDNFMKVLRPHMQHIYLYNDNSRPQNNKENSQVMLLNKYYNETCKKPLFQKCEWYIICDLDEFIYSRNPKYKTILQYLNTLPKNIGQIKIPWKMFGSNGHIKQPQSVIKNFTKRESYLNRKGTICCKSIIRSDALNRINVHTHVIKNHYLSVDSTQKIDNLRAFIKSDEKKLFFNQLACNHYQLQSKEWYINIKCTRGDAINVKNPRNLNIFNKLDSKLNVVQDNELKNKKY